MTHYYRWRRTGSTELRVKTPEERFWAKVEKTETCWNWKGSLAGYGYGHLTIEGKTTPVHRYSYQLHNGAIPDGMFIDHMCHNRACVNPSHLRIATQKQNNENRSGPQVNSTVGVRGVKRERNGRFAVRVGHNGKLRRYGTYDTLEEAEAVAIAVRNELFTHNVEDRAA